MNNYGVKFSQFTMSIELRNHNACSKTIINQIKEANKDGYVYTTSNGTPLIFVATFCPQTKDEDDMSLDEIIQTMTEDMKKVKILTDRSERLNVISSEKFGYRSKITFEIINLSHFEKVITDNEGFMNMLYAETEIVSHAFKNGELFPDARENNILAGNDGNKQFTGTLVLRTPNVLEFTRELGDKVSNKLGSLVRKHLKKVDNDAVDCFMWVTQGDAAQDFMVTVKFYSVLEAK